jgi:hypothetical protein
MRSLPTVPDLAWENDPLYPLVHMLDYPPVGRRKCLPGFWGEGGFLLGFLGWIWGSFIPFRASQFSHVIYRWVITNYIGTQPCIALHCLALPWTFSCHVLECSISRGILKVSRVRLKTSQVLLKLSRVRLKSSQVLLNQFSWVISHYFSSSTTE